MVGPGVGRSLQQQQQQDIIIPASDHHDGKRMYGVKMCNVVNVVAAQSGRDLPDSSVTLCKGKCDL
jgi:hypothetical protein